MRNANLSVVTKRPSKKIAMKTFTPQAGLLWLSLVLPSTVRADPGLFPQQVTEVSGSIMKDTTWQGTVLIITNREPLV